MNEKLNYKKAQKYAIELLSEVVSMFGNIVASGDCNQEDKINLKKSQIALEWVRGQNHSTNQTSITDPAKVILKQPVYIKESSDYE